MRKYNIEDFTNYLKVSKTKVDQENVVNDSNDDNQRKKTVSYRAKAKDLDKEKLIEIESEKKTKKRTNKIDKIKILQKTKVKKKKKRQGWWNQ